MISAHPFEEVAARNRPAAPAHGAYGRVRWLRRRPLVPGPSDHDLVVSGLRARGMTVREIQRHLVELPIDVLLRQPGENIHGH
jgi:hypothetical protein